MSNETKVMGDAVQALESLKTSELLDGIIIGNKTMKEWDEYFKIDIPQEIDSLNELRAIIIKLDGKLQELRYIINSISRKLKTGEIFYDVAYNIKLKKSIEYNNVNRAINYSKIERELKSELLSNKTAIKFYNEILDNFKENYKTLKTRVELVTLLQYNIANELKFLNKI